MLSRRELLSGGVVGSLAAAPELSAETQLDPQQHLQALRDIKSSISSVETAVQRGYTVSQGVVSAIRKNMETFIRSHGKWPDYMEIGTGCFFEVYDWHVKNRQQIVVTRQPDGRYTIQYMFTTLVLVPTNDPGFVGYPYDKG